MPKSGLLPSFFILLALAVSFPAPISSADGSPYWEFNGGSLERQKEARVQRLITLGLYSERDGDRDMLEPRRQQFSRDEKRPTVENGGERGRELSIWGFAPNFDGRSQALLQQQQHRDWPTNWQPPAAAPAAMGGGQGVQQQQQQQQGQWQPAAMIGQQSGFANAQQSPSSPIGQQQQQQQMILPTVHQQAAAGAGPIIASPSVDAGRTAIDRFDTNVDRFAAGPAAGSSPSRIVLPPNFLERISQGIATEGAAKGGRIGGDVSRPTFGGQPIDNQPQQQQERPRTLILTNERISPPPPREQQQRRPAFPPAAAPIVPVEVNNNNANGALATSRTSVAPGDQPVPALPNFRHEDLRPAIDGERLGPQGKFAGQTNEYREDLGKQFTRQQQLGEADGRPIPLTEFGPKRLTSGDGPASKFIGAGINPPPTGTQVFVGERPVIDAQTLQQVTGQQPANPTGRLGLLGGQIRPYTNAPEEITGSRWRNMDEYFNALNGGNRGRGPNRYVKVDLLNE